MRQAFNRASSHLRAFLTTSHSTRTSSATPSPAPPRMARTKHISEIYSEPPEWRAQLASLPSLDQTGGKIPAISLAHGQPMLIHSEEAAQARGDRMAAMMETQGPKGTLAQFLRDLGPALVEKYSPKAIVVFSAHWETPGGGVVTDYGDENPLLYDYYGFPEELYNVDFRSRGDAALSKQLVSLFEKAGIRSRTSGKLEPRGEDGRGFAGPGLDHGVFVPLLLAFGNKPSIPIVQVSIPSEHSVEAQYKLGQAVESLRSEGVLILSGGLTIHNFRDFAAFAPSTAKPVHVEWETKILDSIAVPDRDQRNQAMKALFGSPGYHASHHSAEHFLPIYIAAGAAHESAQQPIVISGIHGAKTIAFL